MFFLPGGKEKWAKDARHVAHPKTGKDTLVYTYHLAFKPGEDILVLDTQKTATTFYLSDSAEGFFSRQDSQLQSALGEELDEVVCEHEALFGFLHSEPTTLDQLTYKNIANIAAYAELYDLIGFVAPGLRQHLHKTPQLWEDVRMEYRFHIALAKKLRCAEVYADALRHVIGSQCDLKSIVTKSDIDAAHAFEYSLKRERLQNDTDVLLSEIQKLSLTSYIAYRAEGDHDPPVKTSWCASEYQQPTERATMAQAQHLARQIFVEWLMQQLAGEGHYSEVRNSVYARSSLRNLCNAATEAYQTGTELLLFGSDAVSTSVSSFSMAQSWLDAYNELYVQEELEKIVSKTASLALPYTAAPSFEPTVKCGVDEDGPRVMPRPNTTRGSSGSGRTGRGRGDRGRAGRGGFSGGGREEEEVEITRTRPESQFKKVAMTAHNDQDCHYFTCVDVQVEDMPWAEDWQPYAIDGLVDASVSWLEAVRLVEETGNVEGEAKQA